MRMEEPQGSPAETICSVCFDDLTPVVQDLLAIPVCGHVFHSHCLLQWFEYCPMTKENSCPVCKQTCAANKVCRLYFQSLGDGNRACPRGLVARGCDVDDPAVLRKEVNRLEAKVGGLTTIVDQQGKDLKLLNGELQFLRKQVKKEALLKEDAFKQKMTVHQMFHMKSQELVKTSLECSSLQERNMTLAKELAALKLSYKELMAKCITLGRGEACSNKKLQKTHEKISMLELRVQELKAAIEAKNNQALRTVMDSKRSAPKIKATSPSEKQENTCTNQQQENISQNDQDVNWEPSEDHPFTLNTDAAVEQNSLQVGLGGVIRDRRGTWIRGFSRKQPNTNSLIVEALALFEGISLAKKMGITSLAIQTGTKELVKYMAGERPCPLLIAPVLENCRSLLLIFKDISITHVKRGQNRVAGKLAKSALRQEDSINFRSPPDFVLDLIHGDLPCPVP